VTSLILKYFQPVLLVFICIFIVFNSCNDGENTQKQFRRDAILENKIDSLNSKISGVDDKLLLIDLSISGTNKQITSNKNNYDKKKKDIALKPADSVYIWTKQRLSERTNR
jgi:hypothetical protein